MLKSFIALFQILTGFVFYIVTGIQDIICFIPVPLNRIFHIRTCLIAGLQLLFGFCTVE